MAEGLYKEWLESENLLLLRGWKMKGLTDQQIADNIGIHVRTLDKWKSTHGQIRQALKRGRQHANYAVENALLKKAMDGNTTAMIFWLKNNYRDKYTDDSTNPNLLKAQIRRATAEADIVEAKAKLLTDSQSQDRTVIIDDVPD